MANYKPKLTEAQLKRQIGDYLEYGMNQGNWYYDRLNSGEIVAIFGQSRRRITLCREGTADFYIIRKLNEKPLRIIFLELKSDKGKTSPAQNAFKKLVEIQGAEYAVIRSTEKLEEILGGVSEDNKSYTY